MRIPLRPLPALTQMRQPQVMQARQVQVMRARQVPAAKTQLPVPVVPVLLMPELMQLPGQTRVKQARVMLSPEQPRRLLPMPTRRPSLRLS